jgi:hypothetical protein
MIICENCAEQRREWDLFVLLMVRHLHCPAVDADERVCWLKRCGYHTPSAWIDAEGDGGVAPLPHQIKQRWHELLVQTKDLDRLAINRQIAEEDKALQAARRAGRMALEAAIRADRRTRASERVS